MTSRKIGNAPGVFFGFFFSVSSGSDCGKRGAEPSCQLELLLPAQELPPPGS